MTRSITASIGIVTNLNNTTRYSCRRMLILPCTGPNYREERYEIFDAETHAIAAELELTLAVLSKRSSVHYQPLVELDMARLVLKPCCAGSTPIED
jgi:hypothetical protein